MLTFEPCKVLHIQKKKKNILKQNLSMHANREINEMKDIMHANREINEMKDMSY